LGDDEEVFDRPLPGSDLTGSRRLGPSMLDVDEDQVDEDAVIAMRRGRRRGRGQRGEIEPAAEVRGPEPVPSDRQRGRMPPAPRPTRPPAGRGRDAGEEIGRESTADHEEIEHRQKMRNIPTWLDVVDVLISSNMANRRQRPAGDQPRRPPRRGPR